MPLVTCVMLCTWPRRAAFISDALASYDAQTIRDRELVIVNDGTPIASARPDVRVYNVKPMTVGEKRNVGALVAEGSWLASWDDDDISLPIRLASLLRLAERGVMAIQSERLAFCDAKARMRGVVSGACYATAVVRREAWLAVDGCPAINALEDMELWIRMGVRGFTTRRDRALTYVARRHDDNVTAALRGESLRSFQRRALPQLDGELPSIQANVDALLRRPRDILIVDGMRMQSQGPDA